MTTHLVIPDCQVKPGVPLDHLDWISKLIVDVRPDVIINIGDFADMESLSSYDKGTKSFEGRRYKADAEVAREGNERLLYQLRRVQRNARRGKRRVYNPRLVITLGNHEQRIERAIEKQPELDGVISYADLGYEDAGYEQHGFLRPVEIDGVWYSHYFCNKLSGRPHPNSRLMLAREHVSCTQGHVQTLDWEVQYTAQGRPLMGLRAGACYLHDEDYKGAQGNAHWRGVILKNSVMDGEYDPTFISLDSLRRRYG